MQNIILYAASVLIWGSTWYAIKFQLGTIDPVLSVAYRFLLAALILFVIRVARGEHVKFSARQHMFAALLGLLLFGINYILTYWSTGYLTSGLVAVCFSTMIIMNSLNQKLFLQIAFSRDALLASLMGLSGILLVFWPEMRHFHWGDSIFKGVMLCLAATYLASLGNIVSMRNSRAGMPVMATNMAGMAYGGIFCLLLALSDGATLQFDFSVLYILSLFYLSLLGSVIAFGCYLTLIARIGADRAGYTSVLCPIVALAISTMFEHYTWTSEAFFGVALILAGNMVAIQKKSLFK